MIFAAILAPFWGSLLTYWRGASIHGRAPLFLDRWLLEVHPDEPSWRLQRGWCVALIGLWPAAVVWLLLDEPLSALAAWAGASAAFTLGHARFQDGGTWAPPPNYVPEDTYLHDALGMAWTGGAMAAAAAVALAVSGLYLAAAIMLLGGVAKAGAYMIGWTGAARKLVGPYWLPTRAAEVLQGFFLYAGASLALLAGPAGECFVCWP